MKIYNNMYDDAWFENFDYEIEYGYFSTICTFAGRHGGEQEYPYVLFGRTSQHRWLGFQ